MSDRDITVRELEDLLSDGAPVQVLDIRDEAAYREWRIPGSEHAPRLSEGAAGLEGAGRCDGLRQEAPVVVVCARGRASRRVAEELRQACGVDARSLEGGMAAWSFAWNVAEVRHDGGPPTVVQVRRTGKGCLSYLAAADGEALAVDPSVEADVYLREAERRDWTLVGVLETHVHADHLSRGRRLAVAAGVPLHLPRQERVAFPHRPLEDGDEVEVGSARVLTLHTPGHTAESHAYLLEDRYLFTGDTLFLDAVGRPDLEARGEASVVRRHARDLYRSLGRLTALTSDPLVLPAHTAEPVPFDGRPVAAPLGEVRARVAELALDEEGFVERLLESTPPAPPNHERIVALNEAGELPDRGLHELEAGANRCAAG